METGMTCTRRVMVVSTMAALVGCKIEVPIAQPARAAKPAPARAGITIDLLVDRTTAVDATVANKLTSEVSRLVQPGDRVRVTRFGGTQADLLRVPLVLDIAGAFSPWRASPRQAELARAREQASRRELTEAIDDALSDFDDSRDGWSPIFEAIAASGSTRPWAGEKRVLILLSDGVQHSSAISFIAKGHNALAPPAPSALAAKLRDLHLLPSSAPDLTVFHIAFGSGEGAGKRRRLRSTGEVEALRAAWLEGYWGGAKIHEVVFGLPMPMDGLAIA